MALSRRGGRKTGHNALVWSVPEEPDSAVTGQRYDPCRRLLEMTSSKLQNRVAGYCVAVCGTGPGNVRWISKY